MPTSPNFLFITEPSCLFSDPYLVTEYTAVTSNDMFMVRTIFHPSTLASKNSTALIEAFLDVFC
jgi:hypothetical protein